MSFTNHTPNYNLPQYVGTDKPTFLGDFNNAMSAIDTALHNNEQNAGEGLSELQQAQAALTETQETLTEVQTEVANVSGIAATVNQNVQQALSAANDATTAANSATSQIQPAVTAANQASADAQAAQQVANGNVTTLNELSERVTVLEDEALKTFSQNLNVSSVGGSNVGGGWWIDITSQTVGVKINTLEASSDEYKSITVKGNPPESDVTLQISNGYAIPAQYLDSAKYSQFGADVGRSSSARYQRITLTITYGKK